MSHEYTGRPRVHEFATVRICWPPMVGRNLSVRAAAVSRYSGVCTMFTQLVSMPSSLMKLAIRGFTSLVAAPTTIQPQLSSRSRNTTPLMVSTSRIATRTFCNSSGVAAASMNSKLGSLPSLPEVSVHTSRATLAASSRFAPLEKVRNTEPSWFLLRPTYSANLARSAASVVARAETMGLDISGGADSFSAVAGIAGEARHASAMALAITPRTELPVVMIFASLCGLYREEGNHERQRIMPMRQAPAALAQAVSGILKSPPLLAKCHQ